MAIITEEEAKLRQNANLTNDDIYRNNTNWEPIFVEDYRQKGETLTSLEGDVADNSTQIEINEANIAINSADIATNAADIATNAADIATNEANIATNTTDIATNATNISTNATDIANNTTTIDDHINSDSEHGVTGNNVGTGDFAQTATGGVVFLADLVSDAVDSTVSVDSPDAANPASATYSQAEATANAVLTNELKADVNQLVTDLNNAITQVNDLLQQMKDANQMNTV